MLFSIAQAVTWICTCDVNAVNEIGNEPLKSQLFVALQQSRRGYNKLIRPRASLLNDSGGDPHFGFEDEVKFSSSAQALSGLTAAIWKGFLAVHVSEKGAFQPLTDMQLADLSLRTREPGMELGMWHNNAERFAYMNPQVLLSDLEFLWPRPVISATVATTNRIEKALRDVIQDGPPLKKMDALDLMKKQVPDFGRRRFEAAWRSLPVEYKLGRGKRGPSANRPEDLTP
jgi:hypothetical protein